ncbi:hypothetical protein [Streptomyces sp. N35]|uniref:hypothetical protein n=1 Tax=Streptomyces sp. N35 TaxID=2795730 RepID=UPI0018F5FDDF|nr:hypothetical protein [Streptomyces sp. N35]
MHENAIAPMPPDADAVRAWLWPARNEVLLRASFVSLLVCFNQPARDVAWWLFPLVAVAVTVRQDGPVLLRPCGLTVFRPWPHTVAWRDMSAIYLDAKDCSLMVTTSVRSMRLPHAYGQGTHARATQMLLTDLIPHWWRTHGGPPQGQLTPLPASTFLSWRWPRPAFAAGCCLILGTVLVLALRAG